MVAVAWFGFILGCAILGQMIPRFVFKLVAVAWRHSLRLRSESGNALPTVLSLVTLAVFGYVAFVIIRNVLRVAVALPF